MKKMFCILCAFILFFGSSPFVNALEHFDETIEERGKLTYDELIEIALDAFPEHFGMSGDNARLASGTFSTELGTPISSQTKSISENEQITYTEYSSGYSLYTFEVDWLINSSASGTGYSTVNTDIYVYSYFLTGMLCVREFSYTHVQYGYDVISSIGSVANSSIQAYTGGYKLQEDANGPAYAYYSGAFENPRLGANITVILAVYVGNDNRTYEVY